MVDLSDFSPEQLQDFLKWSKGTPSVTPEIVSEASRDAQFLSEQASRANKPIAKLGDIFPKNIAVKTPIDPSILAREAELSSALGKSHVEDLVRQQSVPGKSAMQAAETLAPKELPALSGRGASSAGQLEALGQRGMSKLGSDVIETTGRVLPEATAKAAPGFLSKALGLAGRVAGPVGMGMSMYGDLAEGQDQPSGPLFTQEPPVRQMASGGGKPPEGMAASLPARSEAPSQEPMNDQAILDQLKMQLQSSPSLPEGNYELPQQNSSVKPSNTIDFGDNSQSSVQGLKDAQDRRDNSQLVNQLGKSAELIGTGLAGTVDKGKVTEGKGAPLFDQNIKLAEQGVSDYKDRVGMEREDPNSSISKGYRDMMKRFGVKIEGKASAAAIEKIAPWIEKAYLADEQRKAQKENLAYRYNELKTIAELKQNEHRASQDEKKKAKDELTDLKRFDTMGKAVTSEIASSRSAFGRGANTIRGAEAIEQLVKDIDPNELDSRQITEIARSLDGMLSQGQATISGMKKLIPVSFQGDAAKIAEYISGLPKGAQQGEFVMRMMETVTREKELAKEQVRRAQGKILAPYSDLKKKDPEKWNTIFKMHDLDPSILESGSKEQGSRDTASSGPVKTIVKKGYNASTDQTQLIYSDGTKEIVQGKR